MLNTDVTDITPLDDLDAQLGVAKTEEIEKEILIAGFETDAEIPESEVQDNE